MGFEPPTCCNNPLRKDDVTLLPDQPVSNAEREGGEERLRRPVVLWRRLGLGRQQERDERAVADDGAVEQVRRRYPARRRRRVFVVVGWSSVASEAFDDFGRLRRMLRQDHGWLDGLDLEGVLVDPEHIQEQNVSGLDQILGLSVCLDASEPQELDPVGDEVDGHELLENQEQERSWKCFQWMSQILFH